MGSHEIPEGFHLISGPHAFLYIFFLPLPPQSHPLQTFAIIFCHVNEVYGILFFTQGGTHMLFPGATQIRMFLIKKTHSYFQLVCK